MEGQPGPHEETEPLDLTSPSDGVQVELSQADVWVLGQLIDAGTATFPPEIEEDILAGYQILKMSGYSPPPSRGHTSVEVIAGDEPDEPGAVGRDVVVDEVEPPAPTGAGPEQAAEAVIPKIRLREVLLAEISTAPADADAEATRDELASGSGQTDELAAAVDHLAVRIGALGQGASGGQATGDRGSTDVRLLVVDWALVGIAVTSATLFVGAATLLADPVFGLLAVGLLGLAAFLAYPYLEGQA